MPMMAFIGVRISWLMLARNSPLAAVASSATRLASFELAHELRQAFGVVLLLTPGRFHLAAVLLQRLLARACVR